nr:glutaminyl-peptide cyclotransferase [Aurantiacibacter sp. 219JJ12-13]MDP5262549.1 glutaminyl-peptide cyclotransferase [Aurantiacibacter sp. 219JJ12-13]
MLALLAPSPLSAQQAEPSAAPTHERAPSNIAIYDVEVVAEYPHDPAAFTQGLLWHDGYLYESTGQVGASQVRRVDLETGEVLRASDIPADQFGEGLARVGEELISLTWQHGVIHRWALDTLQLRESHTDFPYEGWGLATLHDNLVASDGSQVLRILDPETYAVEREIEVTLDGRPVFNLNELEVIDGLVYANVWFSDVIIGIDPDSGHVVQAIDLSPLVERAAPSDRSAVLNGIAYDAQADRLFVTGKLWPTLFEVRLVERAAR